MGLNPKGLITPTAYALLIGGILGLALAVASLAIDLENYVLVSCKAVPRVCAPRDAAPR